MDINLNERTYLPECPLEQLAPDPRNCRANLGSQEELEELAESIQSVGGLIEPIIARPRPDWVPADHYPEATLLIVSGHRRRVGCDMAGMSTARVHVWPDLDDAQATKIQLMENLHRKDISPIDEAVALRRLMDELGYSTVDCSIAIGKTTQHVRNRVRLLDLPETVQTGIAQGSVSLSVANQLIQLPKPVLDRVIADDKIKDVATMRSHVQYHCMRDLSHAPFDLSASYADTQPCDECPHRGTKIEMFGDESPECPDAACYDRKFKAYRKAMDAHHREASRTQSTTVTANADAEKRKLDNEIRIAENEAELEVHLDAIVANLSTCEYDTLVDAVISALSCNDATVSPKRNLLALDHGVNPPEPVDPIWFDANKAWTAIRDQDTAFRDQLVGLICYTLPDNVNDIRHFAQRYDIKVDTKSVKAAKKAAKLNVEKEHAEAQKQAMPKRRGRPVQEGK